MVFIDLPDRRRRSVEGLAQGSGARVLGIEVTQAVQNMAHEVRLIADKATAVRVYLEPHDLDSNLPVRGELLVSPGPGMPGTYVASANATMLRADRPLAAQRRDAALSLNFLLRAPPAGPMTVRLKRLFAGSGDMDLLILPPEQTVQVTFIAAPMLRIRTLGLRYRDPSHTPPRHFAPDPIHFDYLRSYLARIYPTSGLDWTQAVIDAPPSFVPPFSAPLPDGSDPLWVALRRKLHVQMMLVRQADMDAGWDPRTHYYGLVSDHSGFFRGAANDVPSRPAPNTVAVGPCGKLEPFWDDDASYGDWYGAHELAHTFGRRHPGFCRRQERDDQNYPHANGTISDAVQDCVGFDTGDAALSLPMRAYPHESWVDFMTYCDRQWVSKYTYDGLYQRLLEEDEQFGPRVG